MPRSVESFLDAMQYPKNSLMTKSYKKVPEKIGPRTFALNSDTSDTVTSVSFWSSKHFERFSGSIFQFHLF